MRAGARTGRRRARERLPPKPVAAVSPLPPPEAVFIDWLMSVPHGADLSAAAREQVALLDARPFSHPDMRCLRALLAALAGAAPRPITAS